MRHTLTLAACLILSALLNAQSTIYVKSGGTGNGTSWAAACNLETAVKNATSGTQIWVQKGTYYPSKMLMGNQSMPNPRGEGEITGNPGHGFIRITIFLN